MSLRLEPRSRRIRPAPVRPLPRIEPIAPVLRAAPFDDPGSVFEPKYDGVRGLAYLTPHGCTLRSRQHLAFDQFDGLRLALREQVECRDAILDGEIVALDRHGRPDYRELIGGGSAIAYAVFDILWLDGEDLRPLPLAERKRRLDLAVPANTAHLMKVLSIGNDGIALFRAAQRLDLAGIVAKRTADPYAAGTVWFQVPNAGYSRREGGA